MSTYSASPAPGAAPARIRVVSHPPLPPLRAWLPLTGKHTVGDLEPSLLNMLKGVQAIEFELQGFALLKESPCSILDPANDILDIKAVEGASTSSLPVSHAAAPTPQSVAAPAPAPAPKPNGSTANGPPPPSSSSDNDSSSDSSDEPSDDSSSDSDSSDSDSDAEPEQLSTKPPAPKTMTNGAARPAKRARSASSSSSSGSSSSSSGSSSSPLPLPTTTASNPLALPSTSALHLPSLGAASLLPLASTSTTTKTGDGAQPTVAPGQGLARTKSRNARKRLLKASREAEEAARREAAKAYEEGLGEMEVDGVVDAAPIASTSHLPPTPFISTPIPSTSTSKPLPLDPYSSIHGPQLDMLHLASGNKNKKKTIIGLGNSSGKGSRMKLGTKITFLDEPQRVWGTTPAPAQEEKGKKAMEIPLPPSPKHVPDSPPHSAALDLAITTTTSAPPPSTPIATSKPSKKKRKSLASTSPAPSVAASTQALPPSKRTDLPPNIVVTSVNVEAKHWEAGVGEVVLGTSADWGGWTKEAPVLVEVGSGEAVAGGVEKAEVVEEDWGVAWKGWVPGWKVEERFAKGGAGLRKLAREEGKEGMKVATRVGFFLFFSLLSARSLTPSPDGDTDPRPQPPHLRSRAFPQIRPSPFPRRHHLPAYQAPPVLPSSLTHRRGR
ncbi:hypothetical protein BCR35DRAFT_304964 [Leucosporidium creatinivorum]|uniref:Uncharacterized protein n=1 Tax=Leucosporidium creatinivorum TaxID=106004 RepID=A0A1Y2F5J0_9BASI|nr:hypothetical protein BCR35DRAFT_304964 [Leucosporidium creatinivorum]